MSQLAGSLSVALVLSAALVMTLTSAASAQEGAGAIVYIGTSTSPQSQGIYMMRMDPKTGALTTPTLAVGAKNANFLAIHPNNKFLYACAELSAATDGAKGGGVASYSIDPASGKLTAMNEQPSGGRGPCYVSVDKTGKNVLVANFGSGAVACVPIGDDGKLREPSATIQHEGKGTDPKRQDGPHAHLINTDAANRFALATDLGLDKIMVYRFDPAKGSLTPNDPPAGVVAPGAGPRHIAWHPNQKILYVINEMGNTITAFHYDAEHGALSEFQTVKTLPADFTANNTTAEVIVHPSGKWLYGSNRGHDSIAAFAVDDSGRLTPRGHTSTQGEVPRNFVIDPSGRFLLAANQKSGTIVVFSIDDTTGDLKPTSSKVAVPAPTCLRFFPRQP
jgi:6-phosphogluconolactonase